MEFDDLTGKEKNDAYNFSKMHYKGYQYHDVKRAFDSYQNSIMKQKANANRTNSGVARIDNTSVAPIRFAKNTEKEPSTSEIDYIPASKTIKNGKIEFTKPSYKYNPGAGYLSNSDPIAELIVGDAVLGKPLQYLAKTGLNKILGKTSGSDFAREINGNISRKSSSDLSKALSNDAIRRETTKYTTSEFIPNKTSRMPEYFKNDVLHSDGDLMIHANPKSKEVNLINSKRVNSTTSMVDYENDNVFLVSKNKKTHLGKRKAIIEPDDEYIHMDDAIIGSKININSPSIKDGKLIGHSGGSDTHVWWEQNHPFYNSSKRTLVTKDGSNMVHARSTTGWGNETSYINQATDLSNIKGYEHNPITDYHSSVLYTDQLKNNLYKNIPFDKKPKGAYNVFKDGGLTRNFNRDF